MSRLSVVGSQVSAARSQAWGSWPLALAVESRLVISAARRPADSEPAKIQFLRPSATGRIAFSIQLLSIW